MQTRIQGLVRAGVAVAVMAVSGAAGAQLVDKNEIRKIFVVGSSLPFVDQSYGLLYLFRYFTTRNFSLDKPGSVGFELSPKEMEHVNKVWAAFEETDAVRYEGEDRDGKPHGRGVLVFELEEVEVRFEGAYRDGRPDGAFVMTDSRGSYAEFEFREGKPHGHLIVTRARDGGDSVEGGFRDGKPQGLFVMVSKDTRIEGEFRDGVVVEGTVRITGPNGMVARD